MQVLDFRRVNSTNPTFSRFRHSAGQTQSGLFASEINLATKKRRKRVEVKDSDDE
jgi:hypothetical protein